MGSVCARGSPTAPRPRKPRAIAAAAAPGPTDFLWSSQWSHDWKRPMRPRRRARSTLIATPTGDGTARCGNSPALGGSNTTRLVTPSRQPSASDRAFSTGVDPLTGTEPRDAVERERLRALRGQLLREERLSSDAGAAAEFP